MRSGINKDSFWRAIALMIVAALYPASGAAQSFVQGLTTHQESLIGVDRLRFFSTHVHLNIQEANVDKLTLQAAGMVDLIIDPTGGSLDIHTELSDARKADLRALAPSGSLEELIRADQEWLLGNNTRIEAHIEYVQTARYLPMDGHSIERRGDGAVMRGKGAAFLLGVSGFQLSSILPTPAEREAQMGGGRPPRDTLTVLLPQRYQGVLESLSSLANVEYQGRERRMSRGVYGSMPGLNIRAYKGWVIVTGASGNTDVELDEGLVVVQEQQSGHVNVALRDGTALLLNPNPNVTQGAEITLGTIVSQSPRLEHYCQSRAL